ncbi:MAG: substrate-binding domain-containing protein [Actinomycetota bacterium]
MASSRRVRPNMRDVAALAGVSHMTVSRVINDHPSLREETRERVREAMRTLDYRPNSDARALASRRADRIGVLIDSALEVGPNSTARAVEMAAQLAGYRVTSAMVSDPATSSAHGALQHLVAQGVDALCVIAPRSSSLALVRELHTGVPTLVVTADADETFYTVAVDQAEGAALAVRHLAALGHRRIAHLAGPSDWLDAIARSESWTAELRALGLPPSQHWIGDWTADSGYRAGIAAQIDFTAVFAANDQMALGLAHALAERGLDVPGDVSIVGFDDLPEARHYRPPLTTVRQDFAALGERALQTLLAELRGEEPARHSLIAPTLVVRASTAPPRDRR